MFWIAVPDDVFAPAYVWKGSFEYKAARQPVTLTISHFNATSGRVNVTLTNRDAELLLSGEKLITHSRSSCSATLSVYAVRVCVCEQCVYIYIYIYCTVCEQSVPLFSVQVCIRAVRPVSPCCCTTRGLWRREATR